MHEGMSERHTRAEQRRQSAFANTSSPWETDERVPSCPGALRSGLSSLLIDVVRALDLRNGTETNLVPLAIHVNPGAIPFPINPFQKRPHFRRMPSRTEEYGQANPLAELPSRRGGPLAPTRADLLYALDT